jgi:hypothetical protein
MPRPKKRGVAGALNRNKAADKDGDFVKHAKTELAARFGQKRPRAVRGAGVPPTVTLTVVLMTRALRPMATSTGEYGGKARC